MSGQENPKDAARGELLRYGFNPDHRAHIVPRPDHDDPEMLKWIGDMNERIRVVHAEPKNS